MKECRQDKEYGIINGEKKNRQAEVKDVYKRQPVHKSILHVVVFKI